VKLVIDTERATMTVEDGTERAEHPLYSREAFAQLSRMWVKVGWDRKYSYGFTWMGRPMIQLPEDVIRIQETIYRVKPDVIVETGVAHGGSLVFYASLFKAMGHGRVIGVDIEIRPHNRKAILAHELSSSITLIEGSSVAEDTVDRVKKLILPGERVLVILDSNHTRAHVAEELALYSPLVNVDSYIVATDGIMNDVYDVPHGQPGWRDDNPSDAAKAFAAAHPEFELETPPFVFNENLDDVQTTHWPDAYLRRVR
jgi:cephalosporin hydroxylase